MPAFADFVRGRECNHRKEKTLIGGKDYDLQAYNANLKEEENKEKTKEL